MLKVPSFDDRKILKSSKRKVKEMVKAAEEHVVHVIIQVPLLILGSNSAN